MGFREDVVSAVNNMLANGQILAGKLANAQWLTARNATNTADVPVVRVNASNRPQLGENTVVECNNNGLNIIAGFHNLSGAENTGNAVGVGFLNETGGYWWKGAVAHERTGAYGCGRLVFLVSGTADSNQVTLADTRAYIDGSGNLWIQANCSALSFTDRTEGVPEGTDALAELLLVRNDENGQIDHATLPSFAQVTVERQAARTETMAESKAMLGKVAAMSAETPAAETVTERNLGNMVSLLTVAVQQLTARIEALEGKQV